MKGRRSAAIPGRGIVYSDTPICTWVTETASPGGGTTKTRQAGHFSWGEATKNLERIPTFEWEARNIEALAAALEPIRKKVGRPIIVTSWFRPEAINAITPGAAKNSLHIRGHAADIHCPGLSIVQFLEFFKGWRGGIGIYPGHLHVDLGPHRRF